MKAAKHKYTGLLKEIRQLVEQARHNVVRSINTELLITYWNVGRLIVDKEKEEKIDDVSLRQMFIDLSKQLTRELGKGFSRSNLFAMRSFYLRFNMADTVRTVSGQQLKTNRKALSASSKPKIVLTVSGQLSWSHYCELLKCTNDIETGFYQQTAVNENWSVRELRRQMDTALFERIALSKNAKAVMKLANKGQLIKSETDIVKDPYVLEFLNIPEHHSYSEKHLEQQIIDNLQNLFLSWVKVLLL